MRPLRDYQKVRALVHGHHFIHDFALLSEKLATAGFSAITRRALAQGCDPALLIDRPDRAFESLYVEACKPASS